MPSGDTAQDTQVGMVICLPNTGVSEDQHQPPKRSLGEISRQQLDNLPSSITQFFSTTIDSEHSSHRAKMPMTTTDNEQDRNANTGLTALLEQHSDFTTQVEQAVERETITEHNADMLTTVIDIYINSLVSTTNATSIPSHIKKENEVTEKLAELKQTIQINLIPHQALDNSRQLIRNIQNALVSKLDDQTAIHFIQRIATAIAELARHIDMDNATDVLGLNNQLFELKSQIKKKHTSIKLVKRKNRTTPHAKYHVNISAEKKHRKLTDKIYLSEPQKNNIEKRI